MILITPDCEAIAVPEDTKSIEEFDCYLNKILFIGFINKINNIIFSLSEKVINKLFDTNLYPFRPHFDNIINNYNLDHYSTNDLVRVTDSILTNNGYFENYTIFKDFSLIDIKIDPNLYEDNNYSDINHEVIILILLSKSYMNNDEYIYLINNNVDENILNINSNIDCVLLEPENKEIESNFPNNLNGKIRISFGIQSLLININKYHLWHLADSIDEFYDVINISCYQDNIINHGNTDWKDIPPYKLKNEYIESAIENGFYDDIKKLKRMFKAMMDIIFTRKVEKGHALRKSKGGKTPIQMRGKDKAWRYDIDHEYHIHYWVTDNGEPEFAKLVTHNDLHIPY